MRKKEYTKEEEENRLREGKKREGKCKGKGSFYSCPILQAYTRSHLDDYNKSLKIVSWSFFQHILKFSYSWLSRKWSLP